MTRPSFGWPPHAGPSLRAGQCALLIASAAAGMILAACFARSESNALEREPALVVGGPAFARLLGPLATLAGTPVGRIARSLDQRLDDCTEVAARFAPDPSGSRPASTQPTPWSDALACRSAAGLPAELAAHLDAARGAHDGYLQWPIGATHHVALRFDVDPAGGLRLEAALRTGDALEETLGSLAFFVPDARPPTAARLALPEALVHLQLRSRSGGGLARFVAEGSQGDRLFALKGRLLEDALLEGTLELAFLPPTPPREVPMAMLALHHRGATALEAALEEALAHLRSTWSIEPAPHDFVQADGRALRGGCYADLPLLPELAPCWAVTADALLVGYRPEAIAAALEHPPSEEAEARASGLLVDFERIRALDAKRSRARASAAVDAMSAGRLAERYARLELRGETDAEGRLQIVGELKARP